jgi:hypothetical protein
MPRDRFQTRRARSPSTLETAPRAQNVDARFIPIVVQGLAGNAVSGFSYYPCPVFLLMQGNQWCFAPCPYLNGFDPTTQHAPMVVVCANTGRLGYYISPTMFQVSLLCFLKIYPTNLILSPI